jgi:hypothetical protein
MTTKALHFPGSALVYADRPVSDSVLDAPALGVLVIRFRIKFFSSGGIWLSKEVEPASNGYFFYWAGGSAPIRFWDGFGFIDMTYGGAPALATGGWYEVVTRIDQRSGARLQDCWLNGIKGAVYTSATLVSVAATPLILGHRIDGGGASSSLDLAEVGFWNTYLTDDQCAGMYGGGVAPESCYRYPTGLQAYWPLNGDLLDWSDGVGGGALPLTGHGGIGYAAAPVIFGQPPTGAAPVVLQGAAYSGGRVVLTFDRALLDSTVARDPSKYTITPPGGMPAVAVTDAVVAGSTVSLGISGDVRRGGTYTAAIASADVVRASADEGGNAAGASAAFTVAPVAFKVLSATPLPPYPSTKLRVQFSRAAKQVSAANADDALKPANYAIGFAGGALAVSSVAGISADTVDLTTAAELPGVPYSLTPSNIKSADGDLIT